MMRAVCTLAGVVSLTVAMSSQTAGGAPQAPAKPAPRAIELLWWLPADTETVVVTQTPATPRNGPLFEVMRLAEVRFGDTTFPAGAKRQLRGVSVKASVEGSRHFLPPSGLGAMRYEGATLFVFDKPLGSRGRAVMSELKKGAEAVISVEGLEVAQMREKFENDIWTSYITIARPDILIVATDRQYLAEVLRRRVKREGPRALPGTLPEWRWVTTDASYWALRHYRRDHLDEDPSSPFVRGGAAGVFDDGAVGVAAYGAADGRTIVVHYLSTSDNAEAVAQEIWRHPGEGVDPAIGKAVDDTIEVRFTARDSDQMRTFFFFLFAALGHAIYV
jgi:hypothetical protein